MRSAQFSVYSCRSQDFTDGELVFSLSGRHRLSPLNNGMDPPRCPFGMYAQRAKCTHIRPHIKAVEFRQPAAKSPILHAQNYVWIPASQELISSHIELV